MQTTPRPRPTGVTSLQFSTLLVASIMLLIGLGLSIAGAILPFVPQSEFQRQQQNLTANDIDLSQIPPSLVGVGLLELVEY